MYKRYRAQQEYCLQVVGQEVIYIQACTRLVQGACVKERKMVTIKEFARTENCSYEAIRQQIKRYETDLKSHIIKQGRTRFIDEYAAKFLREKRRAAPIVIQEQNKDDELQQLRDENKNLLIKLAAVQEELHQLDIEQRENIKFRLEADQNKKQLEAAEQKANDAAEELALYKPSIFGL